VARVDGFASSSTGPLPLQPEARRRPRTAISARDQVSGLWKPHPRRSLAAIALFHSFLSRNHHPRMASKMRLTQKDTHARMRCVLCVASRITYLLVLEYGRPLSHLLYNIFISSDDAISLVLSSSSTVFACDGRADQRTVVFPAAAGCPRPSCLDLDPYGGAIELLALVLYWAVSSKKSH